MNDREPRILRVVLLGFMSSGKSAVGAALARRLEWDFVDFDVEIEKREGHPLSLIVQEAGEEYLRELERALTREIADSRYLVIAPGGGWILQTDLHTQIRPGTLSVWLRCSPREIVRRLQSSHEPKPLADRPDALETVAEMMRDREELYRAADLSIPTDQRTIESVAFELEAIVRFRNL